MANLERGTALVIEIVPDSFVASSQDVNLSDQIKEAAKLALLCFRRELEQHPVELVTTSNGYSEEY